MLNNKLNDIHINVPAVDVEKLVNKDHKGVHESSEVIRKKVEEARNIQQSRFGENGISSNSDMKNKHVKAFCKLDNKALQLLKQAVNSYGLSARTYFRLIKVSQTIADLAGDASIKQDHVAEALQYRVRTGE